MFQAQRKQCGTVLFELVSLQLFCMKAVLELGIN